jgi:hypothetical protein
MDLVKKAAIAVLIALIVTFYYLCYHFILNKNSFKSPQYLIIVKNYYNTLAEEIFIWLI